MNAKSAVSHLAAALAAFALGFFLANAGLLDFDSSGRPAAQADADPATALQAILGVDDPVDRAAQLAAFFARTDPSTAPGLHEILLQRESGLYIDEMSELLFASWWAKSNPEAAFQNPINPPWADRHPWMRTVLGEWARKDPQAAAVAVQQMPAGPLKGRIGGARAVVDAWLTLDVMPEPSALIGVIAQLEPLTRSGAISHLLGSMIEDRGIDSTLDFARSVPPDDALSENFQQEFLARTAVVLIDHDIDRAIAWADEYAGTPNAAGIYKHLAYYWALRDGQPALEWALSLPDQPAKSTIVTRAWISFSRKHREQATVWVSSHAPHPMMQGAYNDYIKTLAETDAVSALALANRSPNAELRNAMLAAAAEGWMKQDPEAASAWLASAGLPQELADKIRAKRPRPSS